MQSASFRARARSHSAAAIVLALLATSPAVSQDAAGTAEEIERLEDSIDVSTDLQQQLERRLRDLRQEVADLRAATITTSLEIMTQHQVLLEIEREAEELEAEESIQIAALDVQREKLSFLLGGLTRLARIPPETMVARPSAPVEALRTATLLRSAVPAIEDEARVLRGQIMELASVRQDLEDRRRRAQAQRDALDGRIANMNALISRRETMMTETETERRAVEARCGAWFGGGGT